MKFQAALGGGYVCLSDSGKSYKINLDNGVNCSCDGFKYKNNCKHKQAFITQKPTGKTILFR